MEMCSALGSRGRALHLPKDSDSEEPLTGVGKRKASEEALLGGKTTKAKGKARPGSELRKTRQTHN